ncbi:hypothetical protein IEQ34_005507 [Dendrobium chrysotoxum]|uniref:WRKY domain-containing protein n=1 Tax=Dendrobium chrysotoxum TaxID=161865 RepID=A0AAV7GV70_DENCH|nr:hypothetical protein IEQ34_005507 [Dendrobium chrysotoxum]
MDEILNQVLQACRLARELESSLPHIANNPNVLLASCEQVSHAFNKAVYDLRGCLGGSSSSFDPTVQLIIGERIMEDWSHLHDPDSMPTGQMAFSQFGLDIQATGAIAAGEFIDVGGGGRLAGGEQEHAVAVVSEAETGLGGRLGGPVGSMGQRPSRRRYRMTVGFGTKSGQLMSRRDSGETRTVRIPALRTGNLELPPDDGYTWRKYGQKAILGSKFPRSYFRCTHRNFFGCKAKRKVQKLDADPNTYEITYCGNHTCQASPTPLILPSMTPTTNENMTGNVAIMTGGASQPSAFPLSASIELSSWFLKEHESEGKASSRPFLSSLEVGESSRAHAGPSEQSPPVRTGREGEGSVADLADAMFNSGSSSNSMDTIFTFKTD